MRIHSTTKTKKERSTAPPCHISIKPFMKVVMVAFDGQSNQQRASPGATTPSPSSSPRLTCSASAKQQQRQQSRRFPYPQVAPSKSESTPPMIAVQQPSPPLTANSSPVPQMMSDSESDSTSSPLFTPESSPVPHASFNVDQKRYHRQEPMRFEFQNTSSNYYQREHNMHHQQCQAQSQRFQGFALPSLGPMECAENDYSMMLPPPVLSPFRPPQAVTLPPISAIMNSLFI
ncbi:hypothetical protein BGZ99_004065 [Dissophora globulifera]|uniref:Uncharacterized protein n=1 Tax=Dissophora globulifera TaxID=979702 RepID=A0A9P6UVK4_9FUNG|nr:hypothetical protein BGZ99_004065 [Dissophora globulifera]